MVKTCISGRSEDDNDDDVDDDDNDDDDDDDNDDNPPRVRRIVHEAVWSGDSAHSDRNLNKRAAQYDMEK